MSGRPDPARQADRAWRMLAELAERAPRAVQLVPGAGEEEIAGWGVPLPEDVRRLIRRVRGFRVGDQEEYWLAPEQGLWPGGWAIGPPGSAHLLHEAGGNALFVDVDCTTGAWGRVFAATADFRETWAYVAPSLVGWVTELARAGLAVLGDASDEEPVLEGLAEAAHVFSYRPDLHGTPVSQAREGADPEFTAALAGLPDEALIVDLRAVAAPATLHLPSPPGLRGGHLEFQRRLGGCFAVGFPRSAGRPGQRSRSTTTGAWSEAPLPLRASRST